MALALTRPREISHRTPRIAQRRIAMICNLWNVGHLQRRIGPATEADREQMHRAVQLPLQIPSLTYTESVGSGRCERQGHGRVRCVLPSCAGDPRPRLFPSPERLHERGALPRIQEEYSGRRIRDKRRSRKRLRPQVLRHQQLAKHPQSGSKPVTHPTYASTT